MNYSITLIAVVAALGLGAVAAHEPEPTPETEELRAAQHSRDWALQQFQRRACRPGETAVWVADKEADCLREVRP
ncbi:hypothetical protein DBR23_05950 [Acidovorax sp. HMWF018]|uniref:hypothetical protein n=1 Tax=Acidovorax sp. HMWF018 TaxID=2056855 RepID=UPI000D3A3B6A|nr:hypothetical protein [Acidovorax sp. HMWF018]PTT41489.1 hypothetical protein DBR23_05950 [Acidovorax sp. HMWF018]